VDLSGNTAEAILYGRSRLQPSSTAPLLGTKYLFGQPPLYFVEAGGFSGGMIWAARGRLPAKWINGAVSSDSLAASWNSFYQKAVQTKIMDNSVPVDKMYERGISFSNTPLESMIADSSIACPAHKIAIEYITLSAGQGDWHYSQKWRCFVYLDSEKQLLGYFNV